MKRGGKTKHGHLYVCVLKVLGLQSAIPVSVMEQKRHEQELRFLFCGLARIWE
jgi:hypothetical protein